MTQGYADIASVFRSTAEGETGHAHGHLEFLQEVTAYFPSLFDVFSAIGRQCCVQCGVNQPCVVSCVRVHARACVSQVGDPVTNMPFGDTEANLLSAIGDV